MENEIQKEISVLRSKFMAPKKYPDLVELQQNSDSVNNPYNERKTPSAIPPPLLQLLYSHGTMQFPNKRAQHISPPLPPRTSFPNPQQPKAVAGFVIAYSPTQTTWNSASMPQELIADQQLDPLAVEESQVFIEIAQPPSGYPLKRKRLQYTQSVGDQVQIDTDSADLEDPVQHKTSTNSVKAPSKMNQLDDLANPQLQQNAGVQQRPAVVNAIQQQPRAIGHRVGSLQQQSNGGIVQGPQIAVGRSGAVAVPHHPPVVSGFPTFSISFDPLNFLLSLLNFLPIPKLDLDGRTFFGIELKKGFKFPPGPAEQQAVQIGQQQPYRRGTTIHFG